MSTRFFIEDFERTENSDYLHGMLGRALIIATRFDSMCTSLALLLDIKDISIAIYDERIYKNLIDNALKKQKNLNSSINSFGIPQNTKQILHEARDARNEIAHSLTRGLVGCLDTKIKNDDLVQNVTQLIEKLVEGDITISFLMSVINKEPFLNISHFQSYKKEVIDWVISE